MHRKASAMSHFFVNQAIGVYMRWSELSLRSPLLHAARNVRQSQEKLLAKILSENAETEFGIAHEFKSISGLPNYRNKVPVQTYDQLEPFIRTQQDGVKALTAERPSYYARTSGTTGRSKDIPLTRSGLKQVKHAQKQLALSLWRDTSFFKGSILGFASPVEEGRLPNGVAYGSTSGSTYRSLSPVLAKKFIVPYSAFSISDMEAKYQVYALSVLAAEDITGIVAANPSSILKVVDQIADNPLVFLEALETGEHKALLPETNDFLPQLSARTKPKRLSALKAALQSKGHLTPEDVWPQLSAIATWTGGSCGVALGRLRPQLPTTVKVVEYGYGSSEFMGSANVDAHANICLPLVNHHVYEFVPCADWENGTPNFLGLPDLSPGEDYYIFITTRSGLYRYNINDIVRAGEGIGSCPSIQFLQKGQGVTNITGEKLSEHQLVASVGHVMASQQLSAGMYMALADEEASKYQLYIECSEPRELSEIAQAIDDDLRNRNSEYDDKRASGRLRPLQLKRFTAGAGETIKAWSVDRGVREAQYKPVLLDYARNWAEKLVPLVLEHDK